MSMETTPYYVEIRPKVKILQLTPNGEQATFELLQEDHTLGNALRHLIMKDPRVSFCGYSAPHPSEDKIHLRIQCYAGHSATECMYAGLDNLHAVCEHMLGLFDEENARTGGTPVADPIPPIVDAAMTDA